MAKAVSHIQRHGILLLYPVNNKSSSPPSLWSCFFPKTKMSWDWTDDGDDKVPQLWHLRTKLSLSGKVAYAKWYQGRATFFSLRIFELLFGALQAAPPVGKDAATILEQLEDDSPQPTKELRARSELSGKLLEPNFNKAMKELWQRLLVVGHGESDEGGYPSLAIGPTKLLFEELYDVGIRRGTRESHSLLMSHLGANNLFISYYLKQQKKLFSRK